jgi:hypothetical protein
VEGNNRKGQKVAGGEFLKLLFNNMSRRKGWVGLYHCGGGGICYWHIICIHKTSDES